MKIGIVIGHNHLAQGARRTDGVSEFEWNSELASLIQLHNETGIQVFRRAAGGGYSAEIDRVYAQTDAWGADCTVELHFNASTHESAAGCLTLSSGTTGSLRLAQSVHARLVRVMEGRDRGIEVRARHERGGRSLWQGRAPAIMIEPYFGSNAEEARRADARMDQLAEAVFRGAVASYVRSMGVAA